MEDKYYLACIKLVKFTDISNLSIGSCYCPFHVNLNTKAGHLYADEDGIERLYCYVCKKQYTSFDYLTKILAIKDIKKYLEDRFSKQDIEDAYLFVKNYKSEKEEKIPEFITAEQFFKELYIGEYHETTRKNEE